MLSSDIISSGSLSFIPGILSKCSLLYVASGSPCDIHEAAISISGSGISTPFLRSSTYISDAFSKHCYLAILCGSGTLVHV